MKTQNQQRLDFKKLVANCLAETFIRPLFEFTQEKGYPAYVGGLAEILDWAGEFTEQHFYNIPDYEVFQSGNDNTYKAETLNELIIAFGRERFKMFCAKNNKHSAYFLDKYSTIINGNSTDEYWCSQGSSR